MPTFSPYPFGRRLKVGAEGLGRRHVISGVRHTLILYKRLCSASKNMGQGILAELGAGNVFGFYQNFCGAPKSLYQSFRCFGNLFSGRVPSPPQNESSNSH